MTVILLPDAATPTADLYHLVRWVADDLGHGRDAVRTGGGGLVVADDIAYAVLALQLGRTPTPTPATPSATNPAPRAQPRKAAPRKAGTKR